jgi:ABC-type sugar transport system ATPase subunit
MTAAATAPALELRALTKSFGAVRALTSINLRVHPAEVVGLVGDNGAGKSTLTRIIAGTIAPDSGDMLVAGHTCRFESAHEARVAGIETVFQTLALVPSLDIAENVYLGRELIGPGPVATLLKSMDFRKMRQQVEDGFARFGLDLPDVRTRVGALSGGQRQVVAIARAVLWGSRIVVLDEPTAALGVKQTELVLSFVERLRAHEVAVILISHNMQQVLRVADRVCVLRLGHKAFDGPAKSLNANELVGLIMGTSQAATDQAANPTSFDTAH